MWWLATFGPTHPGEVREARVRETHRIIIPWGTVGTRVATQISQRVTERISYQYKCLWLMFP